jgi:two-component system chemotaxis sensor kinase CheA
VIVCSAAGRRFGLIVDSIQDVCDEPITTVGDSVRPESLATAVLQGRVTSLLDVEAIVARLAPPSRTDHAQQHLPAHAT